MTSNSHAYRDSCTNMEGRESNPGLMNSLISIAEIVWNNGEINNNSAVLINMLTVAKPSTRHINSQRRLNSVLS